MSSGSSSALMAPKTLFDHAPPAPETPHRPHAATTPDQRDRSVPILRRYSRVSKKLLRTCQAHRPLGRCQIAGDGRRVHVSRRPKPAVSRECLQTACAAWLRLSGRSRMGNLFWIRRPRSWSRVTSICRAVFRMRPPPHCAQRWRPVWLFQSRTCGWSHCGSP